MPQFKLEFPGQAGIADRSAPANNLEIALTSPNKSVLNFLFSPRTQGGAEFDRTTGLTRNYAGLSWNLFETNRFYGGIGFGSSFGAATSDDPLRRALTATPPTTLHGTLQFGYNLGDKQSLMLSFDHAQASPQSGSDHGELGENLRFGYGFRF